MSFAAYMKPSRIQKHTAIKIHSTLAHQHFYMGVKLDNEKKAKTKITAANMKFMRTVKYTGMDCKRNEETLNELKTEPILNN